jgi:hypothetical protein
VPAVVTEESAEGIEQLGERRQARRELAADPGGGHDAVAMVPKKTTGHVKRHRPPTARVSCEEISQAI